MINVKLAIKKISPEKIYNFLNKYYRWILVTIFVLLICLNVFIWYQYIYLAVRAKPESQGKEIAIDQETLEKVLDNVNLREENLLRVKKTRYFSPFE